jgi:hypothetical protein
MSHYDSDDSDYDIESEHQKDVERLVKHTHQEALALSDIHDKPEQREQAQSIQRKLLCIKNRMQWFLGVDTYVPPHKRVANQECLTQPEFQAKYDAIVAPGKKLDDNQLLDLCEYVTGMNRRTRKYRAYMNNEYNAMWNDVFGFDINFKACFRDKNSLTPIDDAWARNQAMYAFFENDLQTVFDVFSGKGSDFLSWAMVPSMRRVYGNTTPLDGHIFDRNCREFKKACGNGYVPKFMINRNNEQATLYSDVQDHLVPTGMDPDLDILYLDPPWNLNQQNIYENMKHVQETILAKPKYDSPEDKRKAWEAIREEKRKNKVSSENSAPEILDMLVSKVIKKLYAQKVYPRVIILKGRWDSKEMERLCKKLPDYLLFDCWECTPYVYTYNFYFFMYKECKFHTLFNGNYHNHRFAHICHKDDDWPAEWKKTGQTNPENSDFAYPRKNGYKHFGEYYPSKKV